MSLTIHGLVVLRRIIIAYAVPFLIGIHPPFGRVPGRPKPGVVVGAVTAPRIWFPRGIAVYYLDDQDEEVKQPHYRQYDKM